MSPTFIPITAIYDTATQSLSFVATATVTATVTQTVSGPWAGDQAYLDLLNSQATLVQTIVTTVAVAAGSLATAAWSCSKAVSFWKAWMDVRRGKANPQETGALKDTITDIPSLLMMLQQIVAHEKRKKGDNASTDRLAELLNDVKRRSPSPDRAGSNSGKCAGCGVDFGNSNGLQAHLSSSTACKLGFCAKCRTDFGNINRLSAHYLNKPNHKPKRARKQFPQCLAEEEEDRSLCFQVCVVARLHGFGMWKGGPESNSNLLLHVVGKVCRGASVGLPCPAAPLSAIWLML